MSENLIKMQDGSMRVLLTLGSCEPSLQPRAEREQQIARYSELIEAVQSAQLQIVVPPTQQETDNG